MTSKTILIVEDDAAMIKILAATLTSKGFDVLQSQDGKQGLEMALSFHPDLILLDLLLPTMSGLEVLKALRKHKHGADIPVMILTNLDENDEIYNTARTAASAYIIKSNSSLESIVNEVQQQLSNVTASH